MPKIGAVEDMNSFTQGTFVFSGVRPDKLGATEYTLVSIAVDETGSVSPFVSDIEQMLKTIVKACKKSPRSENLLVRAVAFKNGGVRELHGFKLLGMIDIDSEYKLDCRGMTPLFKASFDSVNSVAEYGKRLTEQDFDVNGISFVITDGCNNIDNAYPEDTKIVVEESVSKEYLESFVNILIGVNINDHEVKRELQRFEKEGGFSQYVNIGEADEKNLAKLAGFISQSISSQSQALGSGSVSQPLTF